MDKWEDPTDIFVDSLHPARARRYPREAGRGRGRAAGPSGTARTAGRLVSAGRRLLAVADALPVTVLAVIAGAGSFTHIRDTAAEHGQGGPMSWAVAVCVDFSELVICNCLFTYWFFVRLRARRR
jgi:hypothetical protein